MIVSLRSYLTFGDELSDSERKEIWDNGSRLLNWTIELLRLRDAKVQEQWQWQAGLQLQWIPKYASAVAQASEYMNSLPTLPVAVDIEPMPVWIATPGPLPILKIKLERPRGKPRGSQFAEAYADAKFIRQQWCRVFHRERRHAYPTMYDAAAAYDDVEAEQLLNYGRNQNRTSRRKIVR
jgi:hypothetical protein